VAFIRTGPHAVGPADTVFLAVLSVYPEETVAELHGEEKMHVPRGVLFSLTGKGGSWRIKSGMGCVGAVVVCAGQQSI
jgi:hypothetical protein